MTYYLWLTQHADIETESYSTLYLRHTVKLKLTDSQFNTILNIIFF